MLNQFRPNKIHYNSAFEKTQLEVAESMASQGYSLQEIFQATGLPGKKVKKLFGLRMILKNSHN